MQYVIIVFDSDLAIKESPPFITMHNVPDSFVLSGTIVFGPYETSQDASDAGRTLSGMYSYAIRGMHSLSEELDNPLGAIEMGDSPDA